MGWLVKMVCAFALVGILGLACLSMLSIAAAIILPGLSDGQVQIAGGVPILNDGQFHVNVHHVPLWRGGLISPHHGAGMALGGSIFIVLLCCAALLLARSLFGSNRRECDAAALKDQDLVRSLAAQGRVMMERLENLESLLLDRSRRV